MKRLFLLGDSTCAEKEASVRPETGWGEMFSGYLADGWTLENYAKNGRSTLMILLEGIFYDVFWAAEEGDYVIIQFGHNENKPEAFRYSDPDGSFAVNLHFMLDNLMKKGVHPVLAGPISRRRFSEGHAVNTHIGYPETMERVAGEYGIPFAEMTQRTLAVLEKTGDQESKKWFMNFPGGIYENYPDGKCDDTHLRPEGAMWIAGLMYDALKPFDLPFLK